MADDGDLLMHTVANDDNDGRMWLLQTTRASYPQYTSTSVKILAEALPDPRAHSLLSVSGQPYQDPDWVCFGLSMLHMAYAAATPPHSPTYLPTDRPTDRPTYLPTDRPTYLPTYTLAGIHPLEVPKAVKTCQDKLEPSNDWVQPRISCCCMLAASAFCGERLPVKVTARKDVLQRWQGDLFETYVPCTEIRANRTVGWLE